MLNQYENRRKGRTVRQAIEVGLVKGELTLRRDKKKKRIVPVDGDVPNYEIKASKAKSSRLI